VASHRAKASHLAVLCDFTRNKPRYAANSSSSAFRLLQVARVEPLSAASFSEFKVQAQNSHSYL